MDNDMEMLVEGLQYLAQMASRHDTTKLVLDSIKEGIARNLDEVIANRIENATGARP